MERIPSERRGFFSGVLQQGYALGYVLAAVSYLAVTNWTSWGWRGLFAFSLWMSHGTQDICPTFLKKGLDFSPNTGLYIAIYHPCRGRLPVGGIGGARERRDSCGPVLILDRAEVPRPV